MTITKNTCLFTTSIFALIIMGLGCTQHEDGDTALYIGMPYQGGVIAYILQPGDPGYVSGETHGLIASKADLSTGIQWYNGSFITTGATGIAPGTGKANTTAIVDSQGAGGYAAKLCDEYTVTVDGVTYDDWYLPSKDELNKLYLNRVAIGGFDGGWYWSSSEQSGGLHGIRNSKKAIRDISIKTTPV